MSGGDGGRVSRAGLEPDVPPPWGHRPSIYRHIRAHLSTGPLGLTPGGQSLPDDEVFRSRSPVRRVAELPAEAFGKAWAPDEGRMSAAIFGALKRATRAPSQANVRKLYDSVVASWGIDYLVAFRHVLMRDATVDRPRARALATWFARGAADREVVKWALATLRVVSRDEVDLLLTLGRHEEFTREAVDAARDSVGDPDRVIWELARHAPGWARIHAIWSLAGTSDPAIKSWMLREGFDQPILIQWTAHRRATTGGLLDALSREQIDDDLLKGAGCILRALVTTDPETGTPRGMSAYADGAAAVEAYLGHVLRSAGTLQQFVVVEGLARFCTDGEKDWAALAAHGWTPERRARIERRARGFLARDHCRALAIAGLSEDSADFDDAVAVAQALGIDTWDCEFRRRVGGEDRWYEVMLTDDPDRVERVTALALERIPLAEIATYPHDFNLYLIVQELRRFPGTGLALVHAALRSPEIGNRTVALKALAAWGESRWGPETRALLEAARDIEPEDEVRERMGKLLSSQ